MAKKIFRLFTGLSLAAVLLPAGGCDFDLFEKVTVDPHPPSIVNFQYGPASIATGETVTGTFTYVDGGADIELLEMRDLSGTNVVDPTPPPEPTYDEEGNLVVDEEGNPVLEVPSVFFFPGTTGTIEWQLVLESNQPGPHTIKVWLEDSEGSRSEPFFMEIAISI